jgi:hypothetical protein
MVQGVGLRMRTLITRRRKAKEKGTKKGTRKRANRMVPWWHQCKEPPLTIRTCSDTETPTPPIQTLPILTATLQSLSTL